MLSLTSSITRLGIVRHAIPQDSNLTGGEILPSGNDDTSRPTVQMPPPAGHRDRPKSVDEAFDLFDPNFDGNTEPRSQPV